MFFLGQFTDDQPLGAATFSFAHGCSQSGEFLVDDKKGDDFVEGAAVKMVWKAGAVAMLAAN